MTATKRILQVQIRTEKGTGYIFVDARLEPTSAELERSPSAHGVAEKTVAWRVVGDPNGSGGDEASLLEILSRDLTKEFGRDGFELKIEHK
jgi:hypothetical protein